MKWIDKLKTIISGQERDSKRLKSSKDSRTTYDDSDCDDLTAQYAGEVAEITRKVEDQVSRYLMNQTDVGNQFTLIKQNGIVGIAYHPESEVPVDACRAYLYQLKSRHNAIGYVQKLALQQIKNNTEILSYYLKPSMRLQNSIPAEQLYGNVTLEIKLVNGRISHVKAATTYYSDANYKHVRDWEEWYNVVFLNEQFDL